jgi:hypothetical protein
MSPTLEHLTKQFRQERYPHGLPPGFDQESVFQEFASWCAVWCERNVIPQAELTETLSQDLVAEGKARAALTPRADGTVKRVFRDTQSGQLIDATDPEQN